MKVTGRAPDLKPMKEFVRDAPLLDKLRLVGIMALAALVLWGTGYSIFLLLGLKSKFKVEPPEVPVVHHDAPKEVPAFTYAFTLENLTIAVTNRPGTRNAHAQFSLVLDCASEACLKQLKATRAKVLDTLYETALPYTTEELRAAGGIERLKIDLKENLVAQLGELAPREILLKDWVLQ